MEVAIKVVSRDELEAEAREIGAQIDALTVELADVKGAISADDQVQAMIARGEL